MACDIANGRVEPCKDSLGGIDAIYFANFKSGLEPTYTTGTDEISLISNATSDLYKFDLKGANSLEQTITTSRDAGTTYFEQVLSLELKKQDLVTHKQVKLLAYGRPHIIVKTRTNNYFICGLNRGMDMTAGTISSGAAMGDFNGYKLTFTGMEELPANFLDCSTEAELATLFGGAAIVVS